MQQQVKVLAILNIAMGCLGLLGAGVVMLVFGGLSVAGFASGGDAEGALAAAGILGIIGAAITLLIVVLSLPAVIAGFGLLKFRPWARTMTIVLSAFNLFAIPIGTALGIYGLIVLLPAETEALFRNR